MFKNKECDKSHTPAFSAYTRKSTEWSA